MVIAQGGKSHPVRLRLKLLGSPLTYKFANKRLKVGKWVGVLQRDKNGALPSPAIL